MNPRPAIGAAFFLSGLAGLVYEVLWSRYLALFVGHTAYAQVLVLAVYLGGMAVGALAVADLSRRVRDPFRWYAGAEAVLALFGLVFHGLFVATTSFSYEVLFPGLGSAAAVGGVRWAVAGVLILPQAIVLGTTFPLMAAGLVRADAAHPGGGVARAYLLNTLGGALGVLFAGFAFIPWFGLPGTSVAAAVLNLSAAGLVVYARPALVVAPPDRVETTTRAGTSAVEEGSLSAGLDAATEPSRGTASGSDASTPDRATEAAPSRELVAAGRGLAPILLVVAFGTAMASFTYEIGWIRMLSLVLGSATHAFEIMLSAFIFGIAVGAWLIRTPSDESSTPVRLLGQVQVGMGLAALASLPLYLATFDVVAYLVRTLSGEPFGYALFNLGRYGLSLSVMLPSTVLAGMTLPLLTGALLRAGEGERMIGRVYGINTIGSVAGAGIAGLIALPYLGLEGLITAGAALDVALGVWLLDRSRRWLGSERSGRAVALAARSPIVAAGVSAMLFLAVGAGVDFTPEVITSGVYREGRTADERPSRSLFYQDGRTATVSAHVVLDDGRIVLATNGKPDASLGPRWILDRRDTLPELPIASGRDFTTQVLAPAVALAHRPDAVSVANIGHGSGMSTASLLTSGTLERLVTIEIEPLMVEGSLVFLPANGPAFADPRVSYVFDDAKSYFSYRRERFDVIFAEPSNPWVSGTASLFTTGFYERATDFLAEDGALAQWVQLYELTDDLFLSVVAALDAVFPSYRAYLVGDADVAIVASLEEDMREADWSVVESEAFRTLTTSAPPFLGQHMEPLFLFDQTTLRPVLESGVRPNSDYRPVLDLGAERSRFDQRSARGVYSLASSRVNLQRHLGEEPLAPTAYRLPPAYGLRPTVLNERGAWLREALAGGGGIAPEAFPEWQDELVHLQAFLLTDPAPGAHGSWELWSSSFLRAERGLHWGLSGWVDETFYRAVFDVLDRSDPPREARAVVELMHGYGSGAWERAAAAVDQLSRPVSSGELWIQPALLLDVAVLAYLETDRPAAARSAIAALAPLTDRREGHLRTRLLRALVKQASARTSPGEGSVRP